MTEHSIVLLAGLAIVAILALLLYLSSRGQESAQTMTCELRRTLDQILAGNRNMGKLSNNSAISSTTLTSVSTLFQKASKNAPPNSHQINGRISPILPFKKGIHYGTGNVATNLPCPSGRSTPLTGQCQKAAPILTEPCRLSSCVQSG
jgi:hypothetical protein